MGRGDAHDSYFTHPKTARLITFSLRARTWVMDTIHVGVLIFPVLSCGAAVAQNVPAARFDGAALYARLCALCHGERGEGYVIRGAPALGNQDFLASVGDEFLREAIAWGRPGTRMSGWSTQIEGPLTHGQIDALVAFIRSWQTVPAVEVQEATSIGSPQGGEPIYRARCAVCHGGAGEGNTAPSLNNQKFLRSASDGFIRYTVARGRRGTPMASYDSELTSRQIDDLVAFIRNWEQ